MNETMRSFIPHSTVHTKPQQSASFVQLVFICVCVEDSPAIQGLETFLFFFCNKLSALQDRNTYFGGWNAVRMRPAKYICLRKEKKVFHKKLECHY